MENIKMEKLCLLDAGSGGRASQRLIAEVFLRHFNNDILATLDDAAHLPQISGPISMSTDSYTVSPLFFPGGSIGCLAINGTVNDISMPGARPLWLACSFIIEEGLPLRILGDVACDMARACAKAHVKIVTGDTKVVPHGACDKLFINTTGIGEIYAKESISGHNAKPGDAVLVSGTLGDHGLAVMAARENVSFLSDIQSDSAPLNGMIQCILAACPEVHVFRDPTRGGLATTLNEIAEQSRVGIEIDETALPIKAEVADGCSFLGLDPLFLANEGKLLCILPQKYAQAALEAMKTSPYGQDATLIGRVIMDRPGKVILRTRIGAQRFLGMLEGAQLPRIC